MATQQIHDNLSEKPSIRIEIDFILHYRLKCIKVYLIPILVYNSVLLRIIVHSSLNTDSGQGRQSCKPGNEIIIKNQSSTSRAHATRVPYPPTYKS